VTAAASALSSSSDSENENDNIGDDDKDWLESALLSSSVASSSSSSSSSDVATVSTGIRNSNSNINNININMSGSNDDNNDDEAGNVHIPSAGISVQDEMEEAQRDIFVTEVVPIDQLDSREEGSPSSVATAVAAQLVTSATVRGSFEPVRYLIRLNDGTNATGTERQLQQQPPTFVMVDVPPYSPQLVTRMMAFMAASGSKTLTSSSSPSPNAPLPPRLAAILITSRDAIHSDDGPSSTMDYSGSSSRRHRGSDLELWTRAFPGIAVVSYRLDTPRDCRRYVTQVLDGYGPFALQSQLPQEGEGAVSNFTFVETGRPLTYQQWGHDVAEAVLSGETKPPDDDEGDDSDAHMYTAEAIRSREEGKQILALYTPGHSFGSVSYIFPDSKLCCSGFTLPVEDTRTDDDMAGIGGTTGPALDCRGYVTTNQAGIARQMESARALVRNYADRFHIVLPSRGDPFFVDEVSERERKQILLGILDQYEKIGQIYQDLGITSSSLDDF